MERLPNWWDSLTPKEQRRVKARVTVSVVGIVLAGGIGALGAVTFVAEYRDAPRVPEYPRVQEENDRFRLARLSPNLARITLNNEPKTEEQRDFLWTDIFGSLQKEIPSRCRWTLSGRVHENPSSFIVGCQPF